MCLDETSEISKEFLGSCFLLTSAKEARGRTKWASASLVWHLLWCQATSLACELSMSVELHGAHTYLYMMYPKNRMDWMTTNTTKWVVDRQEGSGGISGHFTFSFGPWTPWEKHHYYRAGHALTDTGNMWQSLIDSSTQVLNMCDVSTYVMSFFSVSKRIKLRMWSATAKTISKSGKQLRLLWCTNHKHFFIITLHWGSLLFPSNCMLSRCTALGSLPELSGWCAQCFSWPRGGVPWCRWSAGWSRSCSRPRRHRAGPAALSPPASERPTESSWGRQEHSLLTNVTIT